MRNRRGIAAVALVLASGLALSGCGILSGTDGDLANDWAALPAPKSFVPDRGCHAKETDSSVTATQFAAVDCTTSHETETLYVGEFSGSAASGTTPPETDSKEAAEAFDTCETEVDKVLGYDWRDLRLALKVVTPSSAAWKGGARWFACDVIELTDLESGDTKTRTTNIQDGLPTLPLGCFTATESGSDLTMAEVDCSKSHNSEYVGSFTPAASVAYPTSESGWKVLHDKCDNIAASFLGVSGSTFDKNYSEIAWAISKKYWPAGNNNVRCFLWLGKSKMTGSAKGKSSSVPKWS
jgi:Septum formation